VGVPLKSKGVVSRR